MTITSSRFSTFTSTGSGIRRARRCRAEFRARRERTSRWPRCLRACVRIAPLRLLAPRNVRARSLAERPATSPSSISARRSCAQTEQSGFMAHPRKRRNRCIPPEQTARQRARYAQRIGAPQTHGSESKNEPHARREGEKSATPVRWAPSLACAVQRRRRWDWRGACDSADAAARACCADRDVHGIAAARE